ncbi:hypothetical protein [Erythrobacter sp. HL-111]|uniref:hypothetical protein n=1 Tax=Erythrobacter sp. HL-111 TaxID=1798193 RepID=UPI0006DA3315|nr:hypothetical protein [Erythrobacter sp. HL-111]KPP93229.1 MAG: hypothetical protein HLUCCO15_06745 [Erythrobacteraceae bacterium HL-111]SDR91149.1 hypothetical protein SAMN04515621_0614 [Erythrobacter sp. HL-111]
MADMDPRLAEDLALRNAALAVLKADIDHAKKSFAPKAVATRAGTRVKEGAEEVFELAKERADDNRGVIAVLIGALFLFLARQPILEILGLAEPPPDDADHGHDADREDDADHGTDAEPV